METHPNVRGSGLIVASLLSLAACTPVPVGPSDASPEIDAEDARSDVTPVDAGTDCAMQPSVGDLPFDVSAVLIGRCEPCHQSPTLNHAPFPLMSYEDTQHSFGINGQLRWQRMAQVVEPAFLPHMPPSNQPQLTVDELNTLRSWFAACAPPVPEGTGGDNGP